MRVKRLDPDQLAKRIKLTSAEKRIHKHLVHTYYLLLIEWILSGRKDSGPTYELKEKYLKALKEAFSEPRSEPRSTIILKLISDLAKEATRSSVQSR